MSLAHHLMLRLRDDRVVATTLPARRALARAVLKAGRACTLLAFRAADTHLHIEAACDRVDAGQLARRVEIALSRALRLPLPFAPAHLRPILDQQHLQNTFWYILRQEPHHGTEADPHHEASNLGDLLGLRPLGAYTAANVKSLLPRVRAAEIEAELGIDRTAPVERWDLLAEAAAAAACVPALEGRSAEVVRARTAAIQLARPHLSCRALAAKLGVGYRTVVRMRAAPIDARMLEAVAHQLRLRA